MSWKNYGWVATIRGVEPHERNVLWYLGDCADEEGNILSLKVSVLSDRSETPRRRLFQILSDLERKGFIERNHRVWSKSLRQGITTTLKAKAKLPHGEIAVLSKGQGKQIPNSYILRKDRFFPLQKEAPKVWDQVRNKLKEILPQAQVSNVRVWLDRMPQTYYVARTSTLCLLTSDGDHKRWVEREVKPHILQFGPDLDPDPVRTVHVFTRPTFHD